MFVGIFGEWNRLFLPIQCLPCMIDLVAGKKLLSTAAQLVELKKEMLPCGYCLSFTFAPPFWPRKCCLFRRSVARRHRHDFLACCHSQEPAFEVDNLSLPLKTPTSSHLISSTRPRRFSLVGQLHHEMARRPYHECSYHCVRWSKNQQNLVVVKPCHLPE